MEAFTSIRRAALAKRDKAIAKARAEYAETLTRIARYARLETCSGAESR
jgi:hypothetical protein